MHIIYSKVENDYQLSVIEMTDSLELLIDALDNFDTYREDYAKLTTDKRKREFLSARILVNSMLGTQVRLKYDADAKPFIENHSGNISISHSKQFLAVLYHPTKEVGIDIECPSERILKVSKRFLSTTEQAYFGNDLAKIQLAWSAKEAVYKVVGKSAVDFSASLCVHDFELADQAILFCEMLAESLIYRLHYIVTAQFYLVYTIHPS